MRQDAASTRRTAAMDRRLSWIAASAVLLLSTSVHAELPGEPPASADGWAGPKPLVLEIETSPRKGPPWTALEEQSGSRKSLGSQLDGRWGAFSTQVTVQDQTDDGGNPFAPGKWQTSESYRLPFGQMFALFGQVG